MSIFDAAMRYEREGTPLIVLGGKEYGSGSSRDWAAKGTRLLGVRAVIAESFERIHRSNLVGMGVLPLQFCEGQSAKSLGLSGQEIFAITGVAGAAERRRASAPRDGQRRQRRVPGASSGSTRRRRRTTSATAGSCRTCCASSSRPERPRASGGAA